MPIKYGDRYQLCLMPPSVEEYIGEDDVVRAYDAFVDLLDWDKLGFKGITSDIGRPKYDPKAMLKLLLYSYSYGIRSSRKIERACHHNLSYIWLTGALKPDHKTIAEFRRNNPEILKDVFKKCVRFCIKSDLIDGNILFVDGTKIRANASIKNTHTKEEYAKLLLKTDKRIEELLLECEKIDQEEAGQNSHVKLKKELSKKEGLRSKVKNIMQEIEEEESKNLIDPDCANIHSVQGTHASYNIQQVVDEKNGLIVNVDAVNDKNDRKQFAKQIEQANEMVDNKCKTACGDAGYANTDELKKIDDKEIQVIVPTQEQASKQPAKPFSKKEFTYDCEKDEYICPEGNRLVLNGEDKKKSSKKYRISKRKICFKCQHFGICTSSKVGRQMNRLKNEDVKERLEKQYLEPLSQEIYKKRKEIVEHPFGHIKRNLKVDAFLMRGREGVLAEASLFATCFNLRRLISILGVTGIINKIVA